MFYGRWDSKEDVARDFASSYGELDQNVLNADIIFAAYDTPDYEGYAMVLLRENGKLFEVHGSHCSCYGLEGQWEPEEVEPEVLLERVERASWGIAKDYAEQIRSALL